MLDKIYRISLIFLFNSLGLLSIAILLLVYLETLRWI